MSVPHEEEEKKGRPWLLILLAVLGCIVVVCYFVQAGSSSPRPPADLVQTYGILDCSASMPCLESYFLQAFGFSPTDPKKLPVGLEFQCPSNIEVFQVGTNDRVAPFTNPIDAQMAGFTDLMRCRADRRHGADHLKSWIADITNGHAAKSSETNLLGLLSRLRRPSPDYRLRVILATDAAESTSILDFDKSPVTKANIDQYVTKAVAAFPKMPNLERATLQFILPAAAATAKTSNSAALLEEFWTRYLATAAPTATISNFSTEFQKWAPVQVQKEEESK